MLGPLLKRSTCEESTFKELTVSFILQCDISINDVMYGTYMIPDLVAYMTPYMLAYMQPYMLACVCLADIL